MSQIIKKEKKPAFVNALTAAILSLLVPGLGQVLARRVQRGLLMLGSVASILGLLIWRIKVLGRLADGFWPTLGKSLDKAPMFVGFGLAAIGAIWLWIVIDAARQTNPKKQFGNSIFALILVVFFTIGWQISEIDLVKLTSDANEAWVPLSKILWPWEAAVTHETDTVEAVPRS